MAGLRFRASTLPDGLRDERAGGIRLPADSSLDAAAVGSRSIDGVAPPVASPDSRAPFAAAVRESSR